LSANEVGVLVQAGDLASDSWTWPTPGLPVFIDASGQLTTTRPQGALVQRLGFVRDARTILIAIDAETTPVPADHVDANLLFVGTAPITAAESFTTSDRIITLGINNATSGASGAMTALQVQQLEANTTELVSHTAALASLETTKAPVAHQHDMTDVDGLTLAIDELTAGLAAKTDKVVPAAVGSFAGLDGSGSLVDTGFLGSDFAPAGHTHAEADITGLASSLANKASRAHLNALNEIFVTVDRTGPVDVPTGPALATVLDGYVAKAGDTMSGPLNLAGAISSGLHAVHKNYVDTLVSGKADTGHVHVIANVTGLQAALDDKADISHAHAVADVTGLQTALDGKANTSHAHAIADVTNLQFTLDGKAATSHAHAVADVTGLQTALDGKAAAMHNHSLSSLSDVNTVGLMVSNVLIWNGSAWVPGTTSGGSVVLPSGQLAYGTGTGITSSADMFYDDTIASLYINTTNPNNDGSEIILRTAQHSAGGGESELLLSTPVSGASSVYLAAGDNSTTGDGGNINIGAGSSVDGYAGQLNLTGGNGSVGGGIYIASGHSSADLGGELVLDAGNTSDAGSSGGDVFIRAGLNTSDANNSGTISLDTNGQTRLELSQHGDWRVEGSAGLAGQALVSNGAGSPPAWGYVGGGGGDGGVKAFGAVNTSTTIVPRVEALALWQRYALPVTNVVLVPDGGWSQPDPLPATTLTTTAPDETPGLEDPGETLVTVGENGNFLINVRCRLNIVYANPADKVEGFVRISAWQEAGDAAEAVAVPRLLGYWDVVDGFSTTLRAAGLASPQGGTNFQQDVNVVWQAGLYTSELKFTVANYLTDAMGNIGSPVLSVQDAIVRVTKLATAEYMLPM
jgi:hypothetical protein